MQPFQPFSADAVRWSALLIATALISVVFFNMTAGLLEPLALAAITGVMVNPVNRWIVARLGGRKSLGSTLTLLLMCLTIILPLLGIIAVAVGQAEGLARGVSHLAQRLSDVDWHSKVPDWIPFEGSLEELWPRVLSKLGDLLQATATFFVASLSSVTFGAATFILRMFVFFYALFFFLQMDTPILVQLLRFTGLSAQTQSRLNDRIMSISRATIKGTLSIAMIQGALGGAAFWLVGIPGAAFWTIVMMVMAVLPAVGAPGVLIGGAIFLAAKEDYFAAVGLSVWAIVVVSSIDNILRPILVGRDAKLHDIIILISTLGGLGMFGASGMILGPVLAGLFVTIWTTLAESLSETGSLDPGPRPEPQDQGGHRPGRGSQPEVRK